MAFVQCKHPLQSWQENLMFISCIAIHGHIQKPMRILILSTLTLGNINNAISIHTKSNFLILTQNMARWINSLIQYTQNDWSACTFAQIKLDRETVPCSSAKMKADYFLRRIFLQTTVIRKTIHHQITWNWDKTVVEKLPPIFLKYPQYEKK